MDEESLRKEITQQVQAQFEDQLREVKHEKVSIEEDMEAASQRWRAERRRLNSEIERLEDALSSRRALGDSGSESVDTGDLEQAIEERLRQASAEWASERERLKSEISRLEHSVTEAIARSSNPIRTTQSIKDQFEVKLVEAEGMRLRVEREFLHARSNWEEEKKKLVGELMKLRKLTPSSALQVKEMMDRLHNRTESMEEARIRELETQLAETRATILQYHDAAMKTSQELAAARKGAQNLNRELNEIRQQIDSGSVEQLRRQYDANIQDLSERNQQLAQKLQAVPQAAAVGSSSTVAAAASSLAGSTDLDAEIDRIGKAIEAIDSLVDDPDTPASIIARKNAEKSALEAYLRGILFSLGRGEAM